MAGYVPGRSSEPGLSWAYCVTLERMRRKVEEMEVVEEMEEVEEVEKREEVDFLQWTCYTTAQSSS